MVNCAFCGGAFCKPRKLDQLPPNCPCLLTDQQEEIFELYHEEENWLMATKSALTESGGYGSDTRVVEIIKFAKRCGYEHIGLAFCVGLKKEAATFVKIMQHHGFQVSSVICKNGAIPKSRLGISNEQQVRPGQEESMCNPIGQATLLNEAKVDLNVVLGLCVGHDSLFIKHADAPVTILAVKDRVTGHNPLAPIYLADGYYKNKLMGDEPIEY